MRNLLVYFILNVFVITSCSNEIPCDEIQFREGRSYYRGKKFDGNCISRFLDGKIKSVQYYTDGYDDKDWVFYYSNGKLRTTAFFKNGLRVGDWHFYSKNGILWKTQKYDSLGIKTGNWKTYDTINGSLIIDN